MIRRIVGESTAVSAHWSNQVPLTWKEAQFFATDLPQKLGLRPWKVIFSPKNLNHTYAKAYWSTRTVVIYQKGQWLGTLLHEMAHEYSGYHDGRFTSLQLRYLRLIEIVRTATKRGPVQ